MTDKEILQAALKESGMKQADIAKKLGVNKSTVSTNMRRDHMSVDVFLKLLEVMGYKVAVFKESEEDVRRWIVKRGD